MAKSSHCYQHKASHTDKYAALRLRLDDLFQENGKRYGYRRLHAVLAMGGTVVSEKVIIRLMKEDGLEVPFVKRKKYSSYRGEVSPEVPNLSQRDFHAAKPDEKWLSDITEFSIPAGKVYLSPLVDCFDGMVVSWTIGTSPDSNLVDTMLDDALAALPQGRHPVLHTDRGVQYRVPGWISRMDDAGLVRSMSRKGCSPDNSACERFFGRLKNEMSCNRSWIGVTINRFIGCVDDYIRWYNGKRIKRSLGWKSPFEYRRSLGLVS